MIHKISPLTWYLMGVATGTTLQAAVAGLFIWFDRRRQRR